MKKILIPTLIVLGLLVGAIVYVISYSFNRVQYEKDLLTHIVDVGEGGQLVAEYDSLNLCILGNNIKRLQRVLGVSERERLFLKPDYDKDQAIILKFSDGAEYIIVANQTEEDAIFLGYSYKSKNQWYSISGYKSMDWTQRAVSPEGINTPNEVIN